MEESNLIFVMAEDEANFSELTKIIPKECIHKTYKNINTFVVLKDKIKDIEQDILKYGKFIRNTKRFSFETC